MLSFKACTRSALMILTLSAVGVANAHAQLSKVYEQAYLPAEHNWAFRNNYPGADRLFNAFDYGHAILYEILWTRPAAPVSMLEQDRYDFITKKLLVRPPRMPLEEAAIEVAYAKLAPEAKMMFDWAHLLHRQVYDVWADESISVEEKDAAIAEIIRYYKSRPDLAFSSKPKNMDLMEGQYYSKDFRTRYPKFNGLIWAYHWLQVGLYEPLVAAANQAERQTGVTGTVARFREMLESAPEHMPTVMPMTAAIAPEFARRYPEAAIIFDNLHGMHDVISDILSSPKVARSDKRKEILEAGRRYRDDTSFVMSESEWLEMSIAMGVSNMGGSAMKGSGPDTDAPAQDGHAAHAAPGTTTAFAAPEPPVNGHGNTSQQVLLEALFADTVIRARAMQDTMLVRLMENAELTLPPADSMVEENAPTGVAPSHQHSNPKPTAPSYAVEGAAKKKAPAAKPASKTAKVAKPAPKPAKVAKPVPKKPAPATHTGH